MDAVWFGCIPVVIADHYVLPLGDLVDWESIAVTVAEKQVRGGGERQLREEGRKKKHKRREEKEKKGGGRESERGKRDDRVRRCWRKKG